LFLLFTSFTGDGIHDENKSSLHVMRTFQPAYTDMEFIQDAYNFRLKNNYEIPNHYYSILGIDDPTVLLIVQPELKPTVIVSSKFRDKVPLWVRTGILMTETRSYYKNDGTIAYTDKRRGVDIDIGPFQMRRSAFEDVKKRGESFWKLEKDTSYAEELACRYLLLIYNGKGNKNWSTTVMKYNTGPYRKTTTQKGRAYLNKVKINSNNI
jgi:hypothetical protein